MDGLSTQILRADIDVECPACKFLFWVRMSEIVTQVDVLCPCCRSRIRLIDDGGGASTLGPRLDSIITKSVRGLP